MSDQEAVIEIEGLTKRYDEFVALDALSLKVHRGQILGFIGPNGAGKTTTIRILVGLLKPTSGSARIADADCLTESRKIKRLVGYMPDEFGKYDNMRVSEYLDFFGAAYGIGRRARVKRIDEVLEIAGATHMKDLFVDDVLERECYCVCCKRGSMLRMGLLTRTHLVLPCSMCRRSR